MKNNLTLKIYFEKHHLQNVKKLIGKHHIFLFILFLATISISAWAFYYFNGLGLSYNDARSHLNISRRVVEGLKPGIAQLGSVWLPLPHLLMIPTIWNDFMWHSGLSGALVSMVSYVATGYLIYKFLAHLKVGLIGRVVGVAVFALNLNVLYLQSTAMTELLLIATTTAAVYYLLLWHEDDNVLNLIKSGFWVMMASLTRYDGWFLLLALASLVILHGFRFSNHLTFANIVHTFSKGHTRAEGTFIVFSTMAAFGILLWFGWNQLIFKDALYFAFGPYSARAQQQLLEEAGNLITKGNIWQSIQTYLYSVFYNNGTFTVILGVIGAVLLWFDQQMTVSVRLATFALMVPLIFNILALYFGFSVIFIQGVNGNTWFNVRYGIILIPSIAIFVGYLVDRLAPLRIVLIGLLLFVTFFSFTSVDAVSIDDARVGSSQKNVTEVSRWLYTNAKDKEGFILISAASHDAIIFSSGLSMSRFIHEGTGQYWLSATTNPERWARWIVMRTYDDNDQTYKLVRVTPDFAHYQLVDHYPFADIYQLKDEYLPNLHTKPVLGKQK